MTKPAIRLASAITVLSLAVVACGGSSTLGNKAADVASPINRNEIIDVLPPDSIRSIDDPQLVPIAEAAQELRPEELVLGLTLSGQARAYPVTILSAHEIVNDTIAGQPIAVTW